MISPLLCLILLPVLGAIFAFLNVAPRRVAMTSAIATLIATLGAAIAYAMAYNPASPYQFVTQWDVLPERGLNFTLGVDGLGIIMLVLSALVLVGAVWSSPKTVERAGLFYGNVLLIAAGVIGAFSSIDVFFFYAFHEVALIPTFLLIGIWGSGDRQAAAWKATIYLATGSFILLLGIIGLYLSCPENSRTFDMRELVRLAQSGALSPGVGVYVLLFLGFGILVSLFPFHTWAPQAYACAPVPASMLHAGVLKKFGLYGLLRIVVPIFPSGVTDATALRLPGEISLTLSDILLILLVGNILFVGLVTIAQKRLDWMLGYSSVMHMGYMFLGIASLNQLGLTGTAILLFAHGLSIAALFAMAGLLRERTGTLEFSQLGGLARQAPMLGLLFGFAAMASVGLPGFANFAGEILVFFGAFAHSNPDSSLPSSYQLATAAAVWGVVMSAVYMLRAYRKIFFGEVPAKLGPVSDINLSERAPILLLLAGLMIVGFYPKILTALLNF